MLQCTHCKMPLVIEPINCGIIRCGGYWNGTSYVQFPQHAKKKHD